MRPPASAHLGQSQRFAHLCGGHRRGRGTSPGQIDPAGAGGPRQCRGDGSAVEVEVLGWALLEPEPVVLRCVLEEIRCLLEHVLILFLILVARGLGQVLLNIELGRLLSFRALRRRLIEVLVFRCGVRRWTRWRDARRGGMRCGCRHPGWRRRAQRLGRRFRLTPEPRLSAARLSAEPRLRCRRLRHETGALGRVLELKVWRRRSWWRGRRALIARERLRMLAQVPMLAGRLLMEPGIRRCGGFGERRRPVAAEEPALGHLELLELVLEMLRLSVLKAVMRRRMFEVLMRMLVVLMRMLVVMRVRMRRGAVVIPELLQVLKVRQMILMELGLVKFPWQRLLDAAEARRADRRFAANRTECLTFHALDLSGITAPCTLEVEMLADRVVQQTHARKRIELGCSQLQTGHRTGSLRDASAGLPASGPTGRGAPARFS